MNKGSQHNNTTPPNDPHKSTAYHVADKEEPRIKPVPRKPRVSDLPGTYLDR